MHSFKELSERRDLDEARTKLNTDELQYAQDVINDRDIQLLGHLANAVELCHMEIAAAQDKIAAYEATIVDSPKVKKMAMEFSKSRDAKAELKELTAVLKDWDIRRFK